MDIDRTVLGEDVEPTLENLVSGTAVGERFGCKAYEIPQTDMVWDELAEYLAQGLRNTILYWSPDAIVLGGGLSNIEFLYNEGKQAVYERVFSDLVETPILKNKLGDSAGVFGASLL